MGKKQSGLKFFIIFLACSCFKPLGAQQSHVDSIIQKLEQSKTKKGIDSTRFADALNLIEKLTLNDALIGQLEKAGNSFNNGIDEYLSYRVRYSILNRLIATDKIKSLTYGKQQYEALKNSKTPNASFIRSTFLKDLRLPYRNSNMLGEGFQYFNKNLKEYKLNNDSAGLADCYYVLGGFYSTIGLLDQGIYNMKKSVSYMGVLEPTENGIRPFANPIGRFNYFNNIGVIGLYYLQKKDYVQAITYSRIKLNEDQRVNWDQYEVGSAIIAMAKLQSGQLDSVEYYLNLGFNKRGNQESPDFMAYALQVLALYKMQTGALDEAETILKQCWKLIEENNLPPRARSGTIAPDYYLALIRIKQNRTNEAIALLTKDIERVIGQRLPILTNYKLIAQLHEQAGNHEKAKEAYKSFLSLEDSLRADQDKYRSLSFETEQEMNEKELSITKLQSENKLSVLTKNFSIGIAVLILLLAGVVYYRFRSKQKANKVLEATLVNLRSTQSQLIQSEKMASLGELTAGIAHEIQNPLNFVNNFSEVNAELIAEMKEELEKGNINGAKIIAGDIDDNEKKIIFHGKRADGIVKGMLQHSRISNRQKELTSINELADEYLRLAYHGLRAKDKSFNATIKTDYDTSIDKIDMIPQDIGRAVLNLITNAFYALSAKALATSDSGYEPTISITTKKIGDKVEVKVKDNGDGISPKVLDKIFQPFFTTKPTGQGTGLGLSLSYDIVKAHGGEIRVSTIENEGTEFTIVLPA